MIRLMFSFVLLISVCAAGIAQPSSFQRTYAGYLKDKSGTKQYGIQMDLNAVGAALSGSYSYNSQNIPIRISGSIDWTPAVPANRFEHGNLTILEFNDKGMVNGFFRGVLNGTAITGTWSTPDGKRLLSFQLAEVGTVARPGLPEKPAAVNNPPAESTPAKPALTWPASARCEERQTGSEDDAPGTERTCYFQDFKSHTLGESDYKGRYSYVYTLYRKDGGKYVQVSNATLFREDRLKELEALLNKRIRADYTEMKAGADDCFDGFTLPEYLVNQLGIYFDDDQIMFAVSFGLPGACMAVDGTVVSLSISEVKPYLTNR